jgi:hypothetical protein
MKRRPFRAYVAYRAVPISGKPDRVPPTKRKPFRAYDAFRAARAGVPARGIRKWVGKTGM